LIGNSQWCCSANCGHPIARVDVQLDPRYAASMSYVAYAPRYRRDDRHHRPLLVWPPYTIYIFIHRIGRNIQTENRTESQRKYLTKK